MRKRSTIIISLLSVLMVFAGFTFGQEKVGGPYVADSNTVVLLHFDGSFKNESNLSADAVPHEDVANKLQFQSYGVPGLGQSLYIDNDAQVNRAYVTIPDTAALDMTGSWTIEGWINVFTFGDGSGDYRWVPRLVIKPGDSEFWKPNYWVELWGDNRWFQTGFHTETEDAWPSISSAKNTFEPGKWVHLTFIRDTSRNIMVQMVHDENRDLIWFGSAPYYPMWTDGTKVEYPQSDLPLTNDQDLHIGWAGSEKIATPSADSWLHGFVDEIRISNIVRDFPVPPIISSLSAIDDQDASATEYQVKTHMFAFGKTSNLVEKKLFYSIDGRQTWESVDLQVFDGDTLMASIPKVPVDSKVEYYVYAKDSDDLESTYPAAGKDPFKFNVIQVIPNSKVLDLDFEQNLNDAGVHNLTVTNFRTPVYSSDAKVGNFSYEMKEDSAFLAVETPYLSMEEFAFDMWVKFEGDTILPYTRFIIRDKADTWYQQNYYVRTQPNNGLRFQYVVADVADAPGKTRNDVTLTSPDNIIELDKWFHIRAERRSDAAVFEIRDENDEVIWREADTDEISLNPPLMGKTWLRLGWAGNSWENTTRRLNGKVDGVKLFNYGALNLDTTAVAFVGIEEDLDKGNVVETYELSQNYPNPFNPSTKFEFSVPENGLVKIEIFNILGQRVRTLIHEDVDAGAYKITWDGKNDFGRDVASGVYIYSLKSKDFVKSMKMMLLR
ncbi:MAG: LamG-like jellyroll fold domain-containing protein [Rhodothermaceae bacterium]